jgi:steroid delta-isomerase-like uncharacterized protein
MFLPVQSRSVAPVGGITATTTGFAEDSERQTTANRPRTTDDDPRRREGAAGMAMVRSASVEEQDRLITEHWAAWSSHNMERVLALFTEDLLYEDVTLGVMNRSAAELRVFGEGFFSGFPDVTFEVRSSFANGTNGSAEWVMRGTHKGDLPEMPATGKRVDVRGASVFEFAGDKIRRCSDYWDKATLLRQLGLMPSA